MYWRSMQQRWLSRSSLPMSKLPCRIRSYVQCCFRRHWLYERPYWKSYGLSRHVFFNERRLLSHQMPLLDMSEFRIESLYSYYLQSLCRLLLWKSDKYRLSKRNSGVITSKVCKDFPRESANTFAPSKVCIDFHSESPGRLSGRKYLQTLVESLCRLWR